MELDGDTLHEQLGTATAATDGVCAALAQVDDPPAELAFLRVSANVCRVVHLLRAAGPELPASRLAAFDEQQARALGSVLGGALPADAVARAT